jgi:uncharacterized membrane protein YhaH (DUF805 family)
MSERERERADWKEQGKLFKKIQSGMESNQRCTHTHTHTHTHTQTLHNDQLHWSTARALWIEEGNTLAPLQKKSNMFHDPLIPENFVKSKKGSSGYPESEARLFSFFLFAFFLLAITQWSFVLVVFLFSFFFFLFCFVFACTFCTLPMHDGRREMAPKLLVCLVFFQRTNMLRSEEFVLLSRKVYLVLVFFCFCFCGNFLIWSFLFCLLWFA